MRPARIHAGDKEGPVTCVATAQAGRDDRLYVELMVNVEKASLKKNKGRGLVAVF